MSNANAFSNVPYVFNWAELAARASRPRDVETKRILDSLGGHFTPQGIKSRDAADTVFFANQLTQLDKTIYMQDFGALEAYKYLPLEPNLLPWIETLEWGFWEIAGEAYVGPLSSSYPTVSYRQKPFSTKFQTVSMGYDVGIDDLYRAATAAVPIDGIAALAARTLFDQAMNRLILFGSTAWGLPGFFNNANAQSYTVPATGTGTTKTWSTKTAALIFADLVGLINTISANTLEIMSATDVILPKLRYQYIEHLPFNSYTEKSVLQVFKERTGCRVHASNWLIDAGDSSTARMVAYQADRLVASAAVPLPLQNLGLQRKDAKYTDILVGRCGGCITRKPYGIVYGDGI